MNIIEVQENLKDFSKQQLVDEMQNPRGVAPQFLVLGELNRRKRMEDSYQQQMTDSQKTVAEDAINAAGVPQGGIADMARMMAPKSSVAQNSGMSYAPPQTGEVVPSDAVIGMAIGGMPRDRRVQIGGTGIGSQGGLTEADIAATAAKFGITVDDLKSQLGARGFNVQFADSGDSGIISGTKEYLGRRPPPATLPYTLPSDGSMQSESEALRRGAREPITLPYTLPSDGSQPKTEEQMQSELEAFRLGAGEPMQANVGIPTLIGRALFGMLPKSAQAGIKYGLPSLASIPLIGGMFNDNEADQGLTEEEMNIQPPEEKPDAEQKKTDEPTVTADDGYGSVEDMIKAYYQSAAGDKNFDKWMSVAQAGLAMMQSEEPTLAGALGEAGTAGLKAYNDAQKRYREGLGDVINARVALQKAMASSGLTVGDRIKSAQDYYDLAAKRATVLTKERGLTLSDEELRQVLLSDDEYIRYISLGRALEQPVFGTDGVIKAGDVTKK